MEQIEYNLLFRWFVGLNSDNPVWDATVFSKNRDRLMGGKIVQHLLEMVLRQARDNRCCEEHFTVDGTLIEAWASGKSLVPRDPAPEKGTGPRGKKLLRDTHVSKTDREARLYKKSTAGDPRPSCVSTVKPGCHNTIPSPARCTSISKIRTSLRSSIPQRT